MDLASFTLPSWMPIKPVKFQIGGESPGFKSDVAMNDGPPPGLKDGAKAGGEKSSDEAKNSEAKKKVRPVMEGIKSMGAQFSALPPNWKEGLKAPRSIEPLIGT